MTPKTRQSQRWGRAALLALVLSAATFGPAWAADAIHKVGAVTWHPAKFVGQTIVLTGYLLVRATGYVLFSDEPSGGVSAHDLPVTGSWIDGLLPNKRYNIEGVFVQGGLDASNGNPYHLELVAAPRDAGP